MTAANLPQHPLYQRLASTLNARNNCRKSGNAEWEARHTAALGELAKNLPSGSGIDDDVRLDLERSTENRLVLHVAFHHMDESGYYDGWTNHTLVVTPSLAFVLEIRITGRNRNDIKEVLHVTFYDALLAEV